MTAWWIVGLLACGGDDGGGTTDDSATPTDAPTWYRDVQPIVDTHCAQCHTDGNIAPFALDSYEAAAPMAASMAAAVEAGRMPPWPPDPECNRYAHERIVPDDAIATLRAWADADAPLGDVADEQHGEAPTAGLTRVDVSLPMPEAYTPVVDPDEYRCFVLDWPENTDTYVTGFSVEPGERSIVHHVIAYLAEPADVETYEALDAADDGLGYECFGGPGGDTAGGAAWIGGWVPGSFGNDYPAGTGIPVPAGSKIIVQMHYNTSTATAAPDLTTLEFSIEEEVATPARILKLLDPTWLGGGLEIPAGASDHAETYTLENPLGTELTVWSAGLHMHTLGTSASLEVRHGDGSETCVLSIPEWDFHWQGSYFLQTPVTLGADDSAVLECRWDNSAGTDAVHWGEGSADEMCLALVYLTL